MIRSILCIVMSIIFVTTSYGQFMPVSSINFSDKYQINKSYAGISDIRSLRLGSRQQWINIDGRPASFYASYTTPLQNMKSGAGIEFGYRSMGAHSRFGLGISYNYILKSDFGLISMGAGMGQSYVTLDREKIITPDGIFSDGFYDPLDAYLSSLYGNNLNFTTGTISLLFLTANFEIGMEFDKAIVLPEKTGISGWDLLKVNFQYQYPVNENIGLRLNALFYSDFVVSQSDIGIVAFINRNYVGGLNFRGLGKNSSESLGIIVGTNISRNLILVYAYDVVINRINETGSNSHELALLLNLGRPDQKRRIPPMIFNPRLK